MQGLLPHSVTFTFHYSLSQSPKSRLKSPDFRVSHWHSRVLVIDWADIALVKSLLYRQGVGAG